MSDTELVLVETDGPVAVLTLNRPQARNAVDDAMRAALRAALDRVAAHRSVAVVVLTGAGTAFCAGGDLNAMRERLAAPAGEVAVAGWLRQRGTAALTSGLHNLPQITVAAVNGPASGLGFDLALACDFIVADPSAWFAASFVARGLVPDGGSMYYLPRRIGLARAKDLLFSGRRVTAQEGVDLGLVDVLAPPGEVLAAARAHADRYTGGSRSALLLTKSILDRSGESSLEEIAALGGQAQAICYTTDDHRAAVTAFTTRATSSGAS
jgi:enoyl-CoA hydratase/carnithine racemase